MENQIRIILPQKFDLVVGDTFQLYYRGVMEAPNPYIYSIVSICDKGRNFPRYFEYAPTEPGQHKLTMKVYDAQRNLLGEAETMLNVVAPKAPEKPTTVLVIGDSLTGGGHWINETRRRIVETEGEPAGLGFENAVKFVGTRKGYYEDAYSEGYGGWHWDSFLYNVPGAMMLECPNSRGVEDQHSLWQDCNGAIWQLETLQIDYLKFNRWKDHTSPIPEHGPLTHYANAVDTSPIEFASAFSAGGSPFLNPETGKIDMLDYCKRNNIERPDVVYIFLGSNGLMSTEACTNTREDYCQMVVNKGRKMVAYLKEAFPDVKIKIMGLPLGSVNGGMGANYGAVMPLTDHYDIIHYKMELNKAYQDWCLEDEYKDFVEFINISGQFDCEYGYPCKEKPVNTRSTVMERMDTNAAHPTMEGYKQIGDAVYRNMIASFCCE